MASKLDQILSKLERIEYRLERIERSCTGMDSHIGFVENVYGTLRSPLGYITTQVNRLTGTSSQSLPAPHIRMIKP